MLRVVGRAECQGRSQNVPLRRKNRVPPAVGTPAPTRAGVQVGPTAEAPDDHALPRPAVTGPRHRQVRVAVLPESSPSAPAAVPGRPAWSARCRRAPGALGRLLLHGAPPWRARRAVAPIPNTPHGFGATPGGAKCSAAGIAVAPRSVPAWTARFVAGSRRSIRRSRRARDSPALTSVSFSLVANRGAGPDNPTAKTKQQGTKGAG